MRAITSKLIQTATEKSAHGSTLNKHKQDMCKEESNAAQPGCLTCAVNAMIATVMASVAPIVMTTATVLWKEAMVPTMYEKLKVTTTCRHKIQ